MGFVDYRTGCRLVRTPITFRTTWYAWSRTDRSTILGQDGDKLVLKISIL